MNQVLLLSWWRRDFRLLFDTQRMDPASAAVAVVGFSASLATLVGLVINCSRTLYDLQRNLREAPEGILRLQHDLRSLQALLTEIQCRVRKHGEASVPRDFRGLWGSVSTQMERDIAVFMATVSTHSTQLGTPIRKRIPIRIRHIFDENTVEAFRRRISRHIEILSIAQGFIIELVSHVSNHFDRRSMTYGV